MSAISATSIRTEGDLSGSPDTTTSKVAHRGLLTLFAMTATLMQILDSTIANVALPYMQGSLSTTLDQVSWVLTSYVIASAIMTAPVGWFAQRFGRKRLFVGSLIGFTLASMACGAAQTLEQMVLFRVLQGVFGAALGPLSQATMLDIYPFEQRAQAMAIFGIGIMVGPIMGPTLGGWLTDALDWRFVFYVNLPFGILATVGLLIFMPDTPPRPDLKFDWTGFSALAIGVGALQLMLDRGQEQDWFNSPEIIVEAVIAALGLYLFAVHMFTAAKPFLQFYRVLDDDVLYWHDLDGEFRAHVILSAKSCGLPGVHCRVGHGASRFGNHGGHADRQPIGELYRSPQDHGVWVDRDGVHAARDVAVDPGCV